jgi:hypothetical protein
MQINTSSPTILSWRKFLELPSQNIKSSFIFCNKKSYDSKRMGANRYTVPNQKPSHKQDSVQGSTFTMKHFTAVSQYFQAGSHFDTPETLKLLSI